MTMVVSGLWVIRMMLYAQYAMNNPVTSNFDAACIIVAHNGSPTLSHEHVTKAVLLLPCHVLLILPPIPYHGYYSIPYCHYHR